MDRIEYESLHLFFYPYNGNIYAASTHVYDFADHALIFTFDEMPIIKSYLENFFSLPEGIPYHRRKFLYAIAIGLDTIAEMQAKFEEFYKYVVRSKNVVIDYDVVVIKMFGMHEYSFKANNIYVKDFAGKKIRIKKRSLFSNALKIIHETCGDSCIPYDSVYEKPVTDAINKYIDAYKALQAVHS